MCPSGRWPKDNDRDFSWSECFDPWANVAGSSFDKKAAAGCGGQQNGRGVGVSRGASRMKNARP
jgi:hypothetical protein